MIRKTVTSDLLQQIATKHDVSLELVEAIYRHQSTFLADTMAEANTPKILIHNLGSFEVKPQRLRNYIIKLIQSYREGNTDREKFIETFNKLWALKQKL